MNDEFLSQIPYTRPYRKRHFYSLVENFMNLQPLYAEVDLNRIYPIELDMRWDDLGSGWKGAITGGIIGLILSFAIRILFVSRGEFLTFLISTLFFVFLGVSIGGIVGTVPHKSISHKKEEIIDEADQASLGWKKAKFYWFDVSIALFSVLLLTLIIAVVMGTISCWVSDQGSQVEIGGMLVAICEETIPVLIAPVPFFIAFGLIVSFASLVKRHKSLNEIKMTHSVVVLSSIFGVIFWIINLVFSYIFIYEFLF